MDKGKKKKFLKKQYYPGGQKELDKFIKIHLEYPKEALENKIEGSVQVAYDVNPKGKVFNAKIIRSLGYGCDEEAIRVVNLLRYSDARQRGMNVKLSTKITIHFKLPAKPIMQFKYTFKESSNKEEGSNTYQIKIDLNNNSKH
ncbi:MAG: hypothetical protein COC01_04840 [Bacteroidetes bacterium]|nr:energy transducer TonB [Bacteroidia bacterium]PCH67898.1 MAG: hypothetical protein COC01_04840 [Bacteroidota bacterium]